MSGIAGIYRRSGSPVAPGDVDRMARSMAHRGPDRIGTWHEARVGLAHLALWTTPEARSESQPFRSAASPFVLTCDARIDNRHELRSALDIADVAESVATDAHLVLRAYEKWGAACVDRLIGAFAFALWDPEGRRIFCARDHSGVKPFYYHVTDALFAFASEVKALFALPEVPREPDERMIAHHLLVPVDDPLDATLYRDIRALPPAHTLEVTPDATAVRCYWRPDPTFELEPRSDEGYAEEFRERFVEAVRCRMRGPGPIGAFLSGGLDSSAIACAAAMLGDGPDSRPIHTLSAFYDDVPESDERSFIETVLQARSFESIPLRADLTSPLNDVDLVVPQLDRPNPAANLYIHWTLYKLAHEAGVRIVLDGFDGDTTVSHGAGLPDELARRWRLIRLLREERALGRVHGWAWQKRYRRVVRDHALRPLAERLGLISAWRKVRGRDPVDPRVPFGEDPRWSGILDPGFAHRIESFRAAPEAAPTDARIHHWQMLMRPLMFRTVELMDRASALWSIEPRYPFMDKRLIEYCLALPAEQKLSEGWTRVVMRRAMKGILPESIRLRSSKANHAHGFRRGLVHFERGRLEALYRDTPGRVDRYVKPEFIERVATGFGSGRPGNLEKQILWRTLTLGLWLENEAAERARNDP